MSEYKIKQKACSICGKMFNLFKTTDKCCSFICQAKFNNKYNKPKPETTKIPKSLLSDIYVGINDKVVKTEKELFHKIWDEREHKSFLTGRAITIKEGTSFWFSLFAHVLAKGKAKYPCFKLYSRNIILLTPEEHNLLDQGTEEQRQKYALKYGCNWSKIYNLRDELKGKYENLFPFRSTH